MSSSFYDRINTELGKQQRVEAVTGTYYFKAHYPVKLGAVVFVIVDFSEAQTTKHNGALIPVVGFGRVFFVT